MIFRKKILYMVSHWNVPFSNLYSSQRNRLKFSELTFKDVNFYRFFWASIFLHCSSFRPILGNPCLWPLRTVLRPRNMNATGRVTGVLLRFWCYHRAPITRKTMSRLQVQWDNSPFSISPEECCCLILCISIFMLILASQSDIFCNSTLKFMRKFYIYFYASDENFCWFHWPKQKSWLFKRPYHSFYE